MRWLVLLLALVPSAWAQTVSLNPTVSPTTILVTNYEGWGSSLCWWANVVGGYANRTNYCSLAFTTLKLNIVRYNIGGGENPNITDTLAYRAQMPGFEPTNGVWNWNADANQRWVLREAVALGANHVEAFANSPPWWMTISGSVAGATNGEADNLQTNYETNFASYLATVVSNLTVLDGIHFDLVTPMNEPEGPWGYGGDQEGCHMDSGQQARMVNDLNAALYTEKALTTGIDAPETFAQGDAATALASYGTAANNVALLTTHSYSANPGSFRSLAQSLQKPSWISEYGDSDGSGMTMARRIHDDITGAWVSAWNYWQVVDSGNGWGFLYNVLNNTGTTNFAFNEKFYVMGQFSEFVRPGFEIINVSDNYSLGAYNPTNQTLVIVAVNDTSTNLAMTYNLGGFAGLPGSATAVRTSAAGYFSSLAAATVTNKAFAATLIPASVTTFVLTNVTLPAFGTPTGLQAVPANGLVGLSWTAPTGATNYTVLRGTSSGNETNTVANTTNAFYNDTGLVNGTTYYYVISAAGSGGASVPSSEVSVTPFAGPPAVYWSNSITASAQNWNLNGNWTNAVTYPDATQAIAVVNAPIAAGQTVNLNQTNIVGALQIGSSGGAFNLAGNGGALTLDNTPGQASLVQLAPSRGDTISAPVNLNTTANVTNLAANVFTVSGPVAGSGGINLGGSGTVVLAATNGFTGGTTVNGGTLDLSSAGAVLDSTVTLNGGALEFDGSVAGLAFTLGGLASGVRGTGGSLSLQNTAGSAITLTLGGNGTANVYAGNVSGPGTLVMNGAGAQTIGSGTNGGAGYTGATTVLDGTLTLGGKGNLATSSTLDISGNSGACNLVVGETATVTTTGTILLADGAGNGYPGTGTLTVKSNATVTAASLTFGGNYAGRVPNGSFVTVQDNASLVITGSLDLNRSKGGSTAENDALNLNGGTTTVGNFLNSASAGNTGNTHVGSINFNGGILKAGANDPSGATFLPAFQPGYLLVNVNAGGAWINTAGYSITLAATLGHGAGYVDGGLTKLGPGTLNLSGTNTYNGGTVVSNGVLNFTAGALGTGGVTLSGGTLQWAPGNASDISTQTVTLAGAGGTLDVNGNEVTLAGAIGGTGAWTVKSTGANGGLNFSGTNLDAASMTVASGVTLGGTGVLGGTVTVNSGAVLAPGNPFGDLTVSNNLILAAGSATVVQIQHAPPTNSGVNVGGQLSEGGSLTVTNSGMTALTAGDGFKLFNASSYAGSFSSLILPTLTGSSRWNTNTLKTAGTLSVVQPVPPLIGGARLTGGKLVVNGSGGISGWPYVLLSATNLTTSRWTPVITNQFDGSGNFVLTNPASVVAPSMFYRLQLQ